MYPKHVNNLRKINKNVTTVATQLGNFKFVTVGSFQMLLKRRDSTFSNLHNGISVHIQMVDHSVYVDDSGHSKSTDIFDRWIILGNVLYG